MNEIHFKFQLILIGCLLKCQIIKGKKRRKEKEANIDIKMYVPQLFNKIVLLDRYLHESLP